MYTIFNKISINKNYAYFGIVYIDYALETNLI